MKWHGRPGHAASAGRRRHEEGVHVRPNRLGSWIAGAIILAAICLLYFFKLSLIHYPFSDPRGYLDRHLFADFSVHLPASASVTDAYWVAARDPEENFGVAMPPPDVVPFIRQLHSQITLRKYNLNEFSDADRAEFASEGRPLPESKPLYGAPPWWNNPPAADARSFSVSRDLFGEVHASYQILYSEASGRVYISWGRD